VLRAACFARLVLAVALVVAAAAAVSGGAPAAAAASGVAGPAPWRAADAVCDGLFDAQTALILETPRAAAADVARAGRGYRGELRSAIRRSAPAADRALRRALADARRAAGAGDATALAAARGVARAALLRGAYAVTLEAAGRGDAATAKRWLLLREFRTATRFTRPGADATLAVDRLGARTLAPRAARQAVAKDLLDAYQARLRELLADAQRGRDRDLPVRRAEAAAQAAGYFEILVSRYAQDRGAAAAKRARAAFARRDPAAALAALEGFTAAPFTAEEAQRRAQQLLRFLALVPVEYGRGVSGTEVTKDFEIQEAVAFSQGARAAFDDLRDQMAKRDAERTTAAHAGLTKLSAAVDNATRNPKSVAEHGDVETLTERAEADLEAAMPEAWLEESEASDYDLIDITLDRMQAAAGAGEWGQAERARLEAYAFFEFGPERRLKAFDPALALKLENLIWYGSGGTDGLARLIADKRPVRALRETRREVDERLQDAAATLGDSASSTGVVVNSAILVFREGLEAVLILAAITASFIGVRRRLRRPVFIGAMLGLIASILTWALASTLISSLDRHGEKIEAITGLVAIAVLLIVTNWFFHKVYWSEWIGKFHRRRRRLESLDGGRLGFLSGQAVGFVLLGLTSVYREGFETALFLQSLQLSAGTATVVEGAGLGLLLTFVVGAAMFVLQTKLPYKRMLIVTGVMIGFVLVVMVGQTARTMQGTGWLSITPLGEAEFPAWAGQWFGVYPTWESIGTQLVAIVFVVGSYVLAEELRVKRPRRRAARQAEPARPAEPAPVGDSAACSSATTATPGSPSPSPPTPTSPDRSRLTGSRR